MKPLDLIVTARELVAAPAGKPRQSNLRRSISTAYYALFHALALACANMMIGGYGSQNSNHAWRQVYRSLEHGTARKACEHKMIRSFPQEIQDFAGVFSAMQSKRHAADYDPYDRLYKSIVTSDIKSAEQAIIAFQGAPKKDLRAFAAWVLFKQR